jgi:K+-transporting ATPase ATPase A chain
MLASILTITLVIGGTALLSWPLGTYMAALFSGRFARADRLFTTFTGGAGEQDWKSYALALAAFNVVMFVFVFALLATHHLLPLNPDGQGATNLHLIFNTAASFVTNTNLQHYSGESTFSYLAQLGGLMWLQFVSAATGIAALAAVARGIGGQASMGNFFLDVQRSTFLILLPLAIIVAGSLTLSGVPMTLEGAATVTTLEGAAQTIARGPVAAFVAIKQLGTNGGGFFGPNSTHPLENPSFWANLIELAAIIIIPMACVWMFGKMINRPRHAMVLFGVMAALLAIKLTAAVTFESTPTMAFADLPVQQDVGNLEGKELRLGAITGPLWAVITTATSNGSVGAMHDSLNPLTGLVPMAGMWLNETFGGVGVGMINMFLYIALAVFVAGMMVGRTPEYLGHRIEGREMRLVVLALISHPLLILGGTALFAATPWGLDTLNNTGAHGFSEILYEFSSAAANNGSGFEGLGDNTPAWNIATGLVMLIARFLPIIVPLAIVGSLMAKRRSAESAGTLSVEGPTFGVMLFITILIFGALTFFPAAALGPIAEHVTLMR